MAKIPLVKEKEDSIISGFFLNLLQVKVSLWCFPPVPNGFRLLC